MMIGLSSLAESIFCQRAGTAMVKQAFMNVPRAIRSCIFN